VRSVGPRAAGSTSPQAGQGAQRCTLGITGCPTGGVLGVDFEMGRWVGTLYAPLHDDQDTNRR
jgi:hypothetical protein